MVLAVAALVAAALGGDAGFWLAWGVFAAWLACAGVSAAKGKWGLVAVDVFVMLFSFFAAFRLAKPASIWARKRYDRATMHRALLRYGGPPSQYELEELRAS
jgi:hypothetical protein